MPSRKSLPDNLKRNKFARALEKLGFEISTKGGSGSHIKATFVSTQKSITIPNDLRRDVLYYLLKEIESQTKVSWEDICRFL